MNTTTIDRAVVQQALEALEEYAPQHGRPDDMMAAITALCTALVQQDEPEGGGNLPPPLQAEPVEPVAWAGYDLDGMVEAFSRVIEAHHSSKHPFHNPIDMDAKMALRILRGFIPAMKAHTAPLQRKPLTKEEIDAATAQERDALLDHIYEYGTAAEGVLERIRKLCRAVERAHGIKE